MSVSCARIARPRRRQNSRGSSAASATRDPLPATQVAELVAGTYDSLWGRTRLVALGGRLFCLDEAVTDPAATALELSVGGVRTDPIAPDTEAVELVTWGDSGYGSWAEPILARLVRADDRDGGGLRCAGRVMTGQVRTPSADFVMPERVTAP